MDRTHRTQRTRPVQKKRRSATQLRSRRLLSHSDPDASVLDLARKIAVDLATKNPWNL